MQVSRRDYAHSRQDALLRREEQSRKVVTTRAADKQSYYGLAVEAALQQGKRTGSSEQHWIAIGGEAEKTWLDWGGSGKVLDRPLSNAGLTVKQCVRSSKQGGIQAVWARVQNAQALNNPDDHTASSTRQLNPLPSLRRSAPAHEG